MKKYIVNVDRNNSSENIGNFETLEAAKNFAQQELGYTNPENDSEGINIYTQDGIIMSFYKGQEPTTIAHETGMPI